MGMSYWVEGSRKMDGKFHDMLEIKKFCDEKGVSYPKEVDEYFGEIAGEGEEYLIREMAGIKIPHTKINGDAIDGFEILVSEIPEECEKIRFVIGY